MFESPLYPAALVAYFALGANLLGTGLLLQIHPRSRAVRWHAAFSFWIMAWLALQGWFALQPGTRELFVLYGWVVHLMPAFFFAAALVDTRGAGNRTGLAIVLFGVLTAPFLNPVQHGARAMLWQAAMWGIPALLHLRYRRDPEQRPSPEESGRWALNLALFVVVPFSVIGIILLRGSFLLYAMPLITVVIQFMIFHGVVHHRFYDIEVRAARTGELASRAAEQERLALLGELSATLAHEIRNPLAGIRSLAQRLAEPELGADRRARYVEVVLGEVGRLDRIVGSLLDASKRSTVQATPDAATPLAPLLDDVLLLVNARARRADVAVHAEPTELVAAAPRDALAQALLNLVLNALAHTPAGGRVEIAARAVAAADPPAAPKPAGSEAGAIEIGVRDTGPGVPPDERERIFEPFHTRGFGAGLGLAVVRRIARELDWRIDVADADGGGALFTLRVPSAHAPRAQRAQHAAAASDAEPERRLAVQPSTRAGGEDA